MELPESDAYLAEQSRRGRFTGAVLVSRGGETLLDRAYGLADRATGRPNTPETAFQIASVSKQFTAAAILLLQERGALSVNDRIGTWVPGCPAEWAPITIHHLLTHTSGVGHWFDLPDLSLYEPIDREDLLRIVYRLPLKFAPGSGWAYSSPGYVLLAHIVGRVTGEPYAAYLRRAIFDPLGMADTGAGNRAPRPERQASGYASGEPLPSFELDTVGIGAGDVWSTTHDLARWDAALAAPGLLSAESLWAMFTPHAAAAESFAGTPGAHYGYGWCLAEAEGHPIRFHPGDNSGFASLNIWLPDRDAIVVLLANDEDADLPKIGLRIMRELPGHPAR